MIRFRDEEELHRYGVALDPCDPGKAIRITDLGDDRAQDNGESERHHDALPDGRAPDTKDEMAQVAPFDLDAHLDRVAALQERSLKRDRFRTLLYCRSGLQLIEVKKALRAAGRRDFCKLAEQHGIRPWWRKRAMQIARHFRSEEACKGIPLLEALRMSKKRPAGVQGSRATKASRNGRSSSTPKPRKTNRPAPPNGSASDRQDNRAAAPPQPPVTAAEIDALTAFLEAVGGVRRATYVFEHGIEMLEGLNDEEG